jgi:hypothetical protein
MTEHTPGPWIFEDGKIFSVITLDAGPIQEVHYERVVDLPMYNPNDESVNHEWWEQRNEADGQLIAAAPDLLEACEWASSMFGNKELTLQEQVDLAGFLEIAIAKAKGE